MAARHAAVPYRRLRNTSRSVETIVSGRRELLRRVLPDGSSNMKYNCEDQNNGHDRTIFVPLSREVFAA